MITPIFLPDEEARLAALVEYDALGDELEAGLDEIVQLAARLFDVPIALVSLVDRDRQLFVARAGTQLAGCARDRSFDAGAAADRLVVVPDATLDLRFADSVLVTGDTNMRFYAGAPLLTPPGHVIGMLCLIDRRAHHHFSDSDRKSLASLAAVVIEKLEARRLSIAASHGQARFRNIAATSPDGIVCADHLGRITFWNETAERLFGHCAAEAIGASLDLILPPELRAAGGPSHVVDAGDSTLVGRTVERKALHKSGRAFPIELSLSMWREGTRPSFGAIMRDITGRRAQEERLFRLAHFDALTGLPNRQVLVERLDAGLARDGGLALVLLDLDGFKAVNDALGHHAGDIVLKAAAQRVRGCGEGHGMIARFGGGAFALLLDEPDGPALAESVADAIIAAMAAPFVVEDHPVYLGVHIGIAASRGDGAASEQLLADADLAKCQARQDGRNRHRTFSPELREAALDRRAYEGELRRAVAGDEFELFYQPQVDLADGRLIGAEALLRWRHPTRGLLAPDAFLSALEAGMLAGDVGTWVVETACLQAATWCRHFPDLRMGVNLFEAQFRTGDLIDKVAAALALADLPPGLLELQVTENVILRHDETMLAALHALHARHISISFDNFGSGLASLSLLKRYPLSRLKIDRSFVADIADDAGHAIIVNAVIALGRALGLEVIAEGVETEVQRDLLRASGCTICQGYLFGRPMPVEAFERWMDVHRPSASSSAARG